MGAEQFLPALFKVSFHVVLCSAFTEFALPKGNSRQYSKNQSKNIVSGREIINNLRLRQKSMATKKQALPHMVYIA